MAAKSAPIEPAKYQNFGFASTGDDKEDIGTMKYQNFGMVGGPVFLPSTVSGPPLRMMLGFGS